MENRISILSSGPRSTLYLLAMELISLSDINLHAASIIDTLIIFMNKNWSYLLNMLAFDMPVCKQSVLKLSTARKLMSIKLKTCSFHLVRLSMHTSLIYIYGKKEIWFYFLDVHFGV